MTELGLHLTWPMLGFALASKTCLPAALAAMLMVCTACYWLPSKTPCSGHQQDPADSLICVCALQIPVRSILEGTTQRISVQAVARGCCDGPCPAGIRG